MRTCWGSGTTNPRADVAPFEAPDLDAGHAGKEHLTRRSSRFRSAPSKVLHLRDNGICGICYTAVDFSLRNPHPGSAQKDHIVHKSRRGDHTWDNLRLTHRQCNLERNNGWRGEIYPERALSLMGEAIHRYENPEIYLPIRIAKSREYLEAEQHALSEAERNLTRARSRMVKDPDGVVVAEEDLRVVRRKIELWQADVLKLEARLAAAQTATGAMR